MHGVPSFMSLNHPLFTVSANIAVQIDHIILIATVSFTIDSHIILKNWPLIVNLLFDLHRKWGQFYFKTISKCWTSILIKPWTWSPSEYENERTSEWTLITAPRSTVHLKMFGFSITITKATNCFESQPACVQYPYTNVLQRFHSSSKSYWVQNLLPRTLQLQLNC